MTKNSEKYDVALAFVGLHIIDETIRFTLDSVKFWPKILAGDFDRELDMAFYTATSRPTTEYQRGLPDVAVAIVSFKSRIRHQIQQIFAEAALEEKLKREKELAETLQELRSHNKPHEMGTVAEIAARYGVSKSEVRRLKAAGLLHTLQERTVG